ncbi:MAG: IS110 family transposase, partial [Actinomycetota bacterium]|nr:IS110 family transposase [Actinomycetota bacterium]
KPEVVRIETTAKAIRRFVDRLGGPGGLAVCYEAGSGGFALWRLLAGMGVACDVVAPSLVPVRAGDRVKTDRRDAKKLAGLYRAGLLRFVHPPTPELEGLRDLLRCRDDIRCARTAARHRVLKQLLRHGRIYRDGKATFTRKHRQWVSAQRLDDPFAQLALEQMLIHLDGIERQLDTLDAKLEQVAGSDRWAGQVEILTRFRGIATLTALGLIAEIGDFARFSHPRELASWLGITPTKYSSGDQQHRGHITKAGNRHARRLLVECAWHYRHAPRRPATGPQPDERAWQAQVRLHHRYPPSHRARQALDRRQRRDRPRARRLPVGRHDRPAPDHPRPAPGGRRLANASPWWGRAAGASRPEDPRSVYAIPTRDPSQRQLTTGHCPAVPTRASQSDSRRCPCTGRPAPPPATMTTDQQQQQQSQRPLDTRVHLRPKVAPGVAWAAVVTAPPRLYESGHGVNSSVC